MCVDKCKILGGVNSKCEQSHRVVGATAIKQRDHKTAVCKHLNLFILLSIRYMTRIYMVCSLLPFFILFLVHLKNDVAVLRKVKCIIRYSECVVTIFYLALMWFP